MDSAITLTIGLESTTPPFQDVSTSHYVVLDAEITSPSVDGRSASDVTSVCVWTKDGEGFDLGARVDFAGKTMVEFLEKLRQAGDDGVKLSVNTAPAPVAKDDGIMCDCDTGPAGGTLHIKVHDVAAGTWGRYGVELQHPQWCLCRQPGLYERVEALCLAFLRETDGDLAAASDMWIEYMDEEGDWIRISTQSELVYAALLMGKNPLRLTARRARNVVTDIGSDLEEVETLFRDQMIEEDPTDADTRKGGGGWRWVTNGQLPRGDVMRAQIDPMRELIRHWNQQGVVWKTGLPRASDKFGMDDMRTMGLVGYYISKSERTPGLYTSQCGILEALGASKLDMWMCGAAGGGGDLKGFAEPLTATVPLSHSAVLNWKREQQKTKKRNDRVPTPTQSDPSPLCVPRQSSPSLSNILWKDPGKSPLRMELAKMAAGRHQTQGNAPPAAQTQADGSPPKHGDKLFDSSATVKDRTQHHGIDEKKWKWIKDMSWDGWLEELRALARVCNRYGIIWRMGPLKNNDHGQNADDPYSVGIYIMRTEPDL